MATVKQLQSEKDKLAKELDRVRAALKGVNEQLAEAEAAEQAKAAGNGQSANPEGIESAGT